MKRIWERIETHTHTHTHTQNHYAAHLKLVQDSQSTIVQLKK